ncbi:sll0787 family AIR synthase-like protein [Alphaproteobacteria bacterium KMM 3653]|uniref:Sll0787 family AIR synthase-like protein n=1 Tax=Harenicola maris TaxID=2841044 RepID=A0AAP2G9G1_9RHOB|nr:sll0787 family AIR synthase-like protein [Harenicola maris]
MTASPLKELAERLRVHPSIRSKLGIASATHALGLTARSDGRPGDDAAILPRDGGYDLLAGEGFIPAFIKDDPWFAGWCAVMVNLSDIAAMGGRSTAVIDQIWAPSADAAAPLLQGMRDASAAYGIPLVGGHTNLSAADLGLAASVFGKAERLITSFDAAPGDLLIAAIDHRGSYRNFDNFCAALDAPAERLRGDLMLLPALAEEDLVCAGKDISQGGLIGTALMLAECSNVGIEIALSEVNPPIGIEPERWLRSFPSFGFLLSVHPENAETLCAAFACRGIDAHAVGYITEGSAVTLRNGDETSLFWDHAQTPYLDLGANHA